MDQPQLFDDTIEYDLACIKNLDSLEAMSDLWDTSSINLSSFDSSLNKEMAKGSKKENTLHEVPKSKKVEWVDHKILGTQSIIDKATIADLLKNLYPISKSSGYDGWMVISLGVHDWISSQRVTKHIGKEIIGTGESDYVYHDFLPMYTTFFEDLGLHLPITEF